MNGAKKMSFISLCEVGAAVGNSRTFGVTLIVAVQYVSGMWSGLE